MSPPGAPAGAVPPGAFEVAERARWEDADLVGIVRYSAYTRLLDVAEAALPADLVARLAAVTAVAAGTP